MKDMNAQHLAPSISPSQVEDAMRMLLVALHSCQLPAPVSEVVQECSKMFATAPVSVDHGGAEGEDAILEEQIPAGRLDEPLTTQISSQESEVAIRQMGDYAASAAPVAHTRQQQLLQELSKHEHMDDNSFAAVVRSTLASTRSQTY